ncbi:hypothetical protein HDU67_009546, partial [Dinochytrium kinnereticum]
MMEVGLTAASGEEKAGVLVGHAVSTADLINELSVATDCASRASGRGGASTFASDFEAGLTAASGEEKAGVLVSHAISSADLIDEPSVAADTTSRASGRGGAGTLAGDLQAGGTAAGVQKEARVLVGDAVIT